MARRHSTSRPISLFGRRYPVLREERIFGERFLLLESLGHGDRQRFLAYHPRYRVARRVSFLPKTSAGEQHLRSLFRSQRTNNAFARIHVWEERPESFAVVHEWVPGDDLEQHIQKIRVGQLPPMSPHQAVRLVRGLAHGLDWLHNNARIVHGDLKPANLIPNRNARGLIAVDYGSAWPLERTMKRQFGDGDDDRYAAPELQGATGVVDGRVDQFAVSAILYEMLTGRLPYQWGGKAGRPMYAATMQPIYVPPSQIAPHRNKTPDRVWQALDAVVATGVAFDPERRFRSDREWLDALEVVWRSIDPRPTVLTLPTESTGVVAKVLSLFRRR